MEVSDTETVLSPQREDRNGSAGAFPVGLEHLLGSHVVIDLELRGVLVDAENLVGKCRCEERGGYRDIGPFVLYISDFRIRDDMVFPFAAKPSAVFPALIVILGA